MRLKLIMVIMIVVLFCTACTSKMDWIYTDDKKIASSSDTYGIDKKEIAVNDDIYSGKLKMTGTYTIWEYECEEEQEISIQYLLSVSSGKAKLVFISPDNKVTVLPFSENQENKDEMLQATLLLKKGSNRIKIVAKSKANMYFKLQIFKGNYTDHDW